MSDKERQEIRSLIQEELDKKLQRPSAEKPADDTEDRSTPVYDPKSNVETVSPAY